MGQRRRSGKAKVCETTDTLASTEPGWVRGSREFLWVWPRQASQPRAEQALVWTLIQTHEQAKCKRRHLGDNYTKTHKLATGWYKRTVCLRASHHGVVEEMQAGLATGDVVNSLGFAFMPAA